MRIAPKPTALTPSASEVVRIAMVVDCASTRRISEARINGEWRERGLQQPAGDV